MRLVQKSLLHTGYIILEDNSIFPAFGPNVLAEAYYTEGGRRVKKVYAVADFNELLEKIKEFKEKYGVIPQNFTEELRTGLKDGDGLSQTHPRFCYC